MKIAVLGSGDVGRALGKAFATLGHEVKMGSRDATNEKALAWAAETGKGASAGTFADAVGFGEVIVLATLGVANEIVITTVAERAFMFRPDFAGGPPDMFIAGDDKDAKKKVSAILADFGWGVIDTGGIRVLALSRSNVSGVSDLRIEVEQLVAGFQDAAAVSAPAR